MVFFDLEIPAFSLSNENHLRKSIDCVRFAVLNLVLENIKGWKMTETFKPKIKT